MSAVAPTAVAVPSPAPTSRLGWLISSSIGQKLVMAVTGIILCGFVLGHMVGNLTAFKGADAINAYGVLLRKVPAALWGVRLGLLAATLLHGWAYLVTMLSSWKARPQGYKVTSYKESTWASRTMRWTGPFLLVFIVYHLLHLTTGTVHPDFKDGEIYHNLLTGLQVMPVALFYIAAMLALGLHLFHGVWSLFQSLGFSQPRYDSFGRKLAAVFTVIVVAGFVAVPVAVLANVLK